MALPIHTYAINLKKRIDRKLNLVREFEDKPEFTLKFIDAIENEIGAIGLWESIVKIIRDEAPSEAPYILICEDDHIFTETYSKDFLLKQIDVAAELDADFINGGPSGFNTGFPITENLFWVEDFSGSQFLIIFKRFYPKIINAEFASEDTADHKLCNLTNKAFYIYPFVSIQQDFGYSDATSKNNGSFRIDNLYSKSLEKAKRARELFQHYRNLKDISFNDEDLAVSVDQLTIPTYIIQFKTKNRNINHIEKQFMDKTEFDINFVQACENEKETLAMWLTIRKIIGIAIENEDDVIVVCEESHEFTEHYSKEMFFQNVIKAHCLGADYLNGGTTNFDLVIPISPPLFWSSICLGTQFIVLFKPFFNKILSEPYDQTVLADRLFSEMTPRKMLLFPQISIQKDFGAFPNKMASDDFQNLMKADFDLFQQRIKRVVSATSMIYSVPR